MQDGKKVPVSVMSALEYRLKKLNKNNIYLQGSLSVPESQLKPEFRRLGIPGRAGSGLRNYVMKTAKADDSIDIVRSLPANRDARNSLERDYHFKPESQCR